MTYGAIVTQMMKDFQDPATVSRELDSMGHSIGVRLVDEFLAKSGVEQCRNFRETADVIAKVAFRMFLGIHADAQRWSEDGKEFSLVYQGSPLELFVELPDDCEGLEYSNLLCGVVRGALSQVGMLVECRFERSELLGADASEIRVVLKEVVREVYQDDDE